MTTIDDMQTSFRGYFGQRRIIGVVGFAAWWIVGGILSVVLGTLFVLRNPVRLALLVGLLYYRTAWFLCLSVMVELLFRDVWSAMVTNQAREPPFFLAIENFVYD